jgi:hypothetical protein
MLAGSLGNPAFPDHFIEESSWIEVVGWCKFLERTRDAAALSSRNGSALASSRVHLKPFSREKAKCPSRSSPIPVPGRCPAVFLLEAQSVAWVAE